MRRKESSAPELVRSTVIRLVFTSLAVTAWLLFGCGEPASETPSSEAVSAVPAPTEEPVPIVDDDPVIAEESAAAAKRAAAETGEEIYRRLPCAGCHEHAARPGQPVMPLRSLSKIYSVEALAAFLATPPPPMPRFDLDLEQRRKLASYLLATHP